MPFTPRSSSSWFRGRRAHRASLLPLLLPLLFVLIVLLASVALMPLALVQRYRVGTARRAARGWIATLNIVGLGISASIFLASAALTSVWVPDALTYTVAGLGAGAALGVVGLGLTRWEVSPGALYYTPNRPLVLALTVLVTARVAYGFWRGLQTWRAGLSGEAWLVTAGVAGAMAAGAVVLGYYLVYWMGVRRRWRRHLRTVPRRRH